MRVVVVDDDSAVLSVLRRAFLLDGHTVTTAADGETALALAGECGPDLVFLDVILPGLDGLTVCERLRRLLPPETPILMLSARDAVPDRVAGLDSGADDYLVKPFSPPELALRVSALLRRLGAPAVASGSTVTAGPVVIDRSSHRASVDGQELELTATEFKLLLTLVERRGRVQSRPQLLETVWEAQPDIQTRTVDMHVQRLRAKLGNAGALIETVRGFGYRFRGGERGTPTR